MQKCQLYHEGKIRLLHKLTGMKFLNKEYEDVHAQHNRYKGHHVFPNKSAVENRNHCPIFVWIVDAMKFMLHSKESNLNEEEMNIKSLTCCSVIRCKCILMTQECNFVDLCVLMWSHQL